MRVRAVTIGALIAAACGLAMMLVAWSVDGAWDHLEAAAATMLWLSLLLVGTAVIVQLRDVKRDLSLVRDRSKSMAENINRVADRVEDLRTEFFLGSYAHVPGQVARIEASMPVEAASHRTQKPGGMTPNAVFDRVFVLNLDSDVEKMERTSRLLSAFDIDFERFPAVDGSAPEFDSVWEAYQAREPHLPTEHHLGERLLESRGALGYLETMRAVLTTAKRGGLSSILVLEDDVLIHREFADLFSAAWAEVPDDWRVVYLGSVESRPGTRTRYSEHLATTGAAANGSYAVAIHQTAFDQLLAAIDRLDWPFDAGALREVATAHPLAVLTVTPPLVIADVTTSAIRGGRDMASHADKHGWNLDDYR